jgi:fused signal recognition particle receptor
MFRTLTLSGIVIALIVILSGFASWHIPVEALVSGVTLHELHVYSAYVLASLVLGLFVMAWWQAHCRLAAVSGACIAALLLAIQVMLGIGILKWPGQPVLVTAHLLTGMTIAWVMFWLYLRADAKLVINRTATGLSVAAKAGMILLILQIVIGGWVSVNHAGLICPDFPTCNNQWWPDADYKGGIDLLSGLMSGNTTLSNEALVAVLWLHRVGALVCFAVLTGIMLSATGSKRAKSLRKAGMWLSVLLFAQIGLGAFGHQLGYPLWLVLAHTFFAVVLMWPLLAISLYGRYGYPETTPSELKGFIPPVPQPRTEPQIQPSPALEPVGENIPELLPELKPEPAVAVTLEDAYVEPAPESLYLRLKSQLQKTRSGLGDMLANLVIGQKGVTDELLEEIEANLLMADVGIDVTTKVINRLTQSLEKHQLSDSQALSQALKHELLEILRPCSRPLQIPKQEKPYVILVVGVNGVGKTTTIGKLAKRLKAQGHSVMLAAGDTFRAAAVEQLQTWGERNNIQVVAQHTGADSASVIYDGIQSAQAKGVNVLIADTAGRLHTKDNLMEELKKVKRIMAKLDESAPHEVLLVLDAGTGQNALSQAKQFNETVGLTGLALTKLDGTAKGGVIFALAKQTGIPIRFIGVGEGIDDLQDFNAEAFIEALFVTE